MPAHTTSCASLLDLYTIDDISAFDARRLGRHRGGSQPPYIGGVSASAALRTCRGTLQVKPRPMTYSLPGVAETAGCGTRALQYET